MRVFENGVVVQSGSDLAPQGLRLFATDELPIYSRTGLTIVDEEGRSVTERIVKALIPTHAHKNVDFYEEKDTNYALRASAHHFVNLAVLYSDHTQLVETREKKRASERGRKAIQVNLDDPPVFFETDAFLGTARRFYEQLRRVLWKRFGKSEQRPRSFERVLLAAEFPDTYQQTLQESWDEVGSKLKDYRDSMSHYDPLNEGHTNVILRPSDNRWALTVRLPENPEANSRLAFRFESGPDALSYCYDTLVHLTAVAVETHSILGID